MQYLNSISKNDYVLKALKGARPELLEILSLDTTTPFGSDQEYIKALEIEVDIVKFRLAAEDAFTRSFQLVPIKQEEQDFDTLIELIESYKKVIAKCREIREAKLAATPNDKLPRFERICAKLNVSSKEKRAFEFLVINTVNINGIGINNGFMLYNYPSSIMKYSDMNTEEIAVFLQPARVWVKQNFFEYLEVERIFQCNLNFTPEVHQAFMGIELSDEKLLKIDNTVISEVIHEERGTKPDSLLNKSGALTIDGEMTTTDGSDDLTNPELVPGVDGVPETDLGQPPVEGEPLVQDEEPEDIHDFLKRQIEQEKSFLPPPKDKSLKDGMDSNENPEDKITAYTSDLDYLETETKKFIVMFQIEQMERQKKETKAYNYFRSGADDHAQEVRLRELKAQARVQKKKCEKRLALTREAKGWMPRMERMAQIRGLDEFEKEMILALISTHISAEMQTLGHRRGLTVGSILRGFCGSFEEQIQHRSYFYKGSKMIKEGIIRLSGGSALDDDLMDAHVTIDRRMLEFVMGLDTEFSELVEGSHLYYPKVQLDHVVLPEETKKLILTTVRNFEGYKRARKRMGFDDTIGYGSGIVMLFFGASGTGKTMMANSIANHLEKKILLINFPSLGKMSAGENLKFVFREAKINDAILFFDECESIFESRDRGNFEVNLLLTEIERHDGLIIMATNRAYDLDEAMHRRVTLSIEFTKPDPLLRESIWRSNIPPELKLAADVNVKDLAMNFELTGGFIKNAILSALSMAVGRDGEKDAVVRQEDLEAGARLQLRGRLRMIDFEHRVVPTRGVESLVLPQSKIALLKEIINYEKARQVLFGQWGFDKVIGQDKANSCLFWGPPGTGKTLAAEAIAFSTGKPLKLVNTGELLSKWVGDTGKNINAVFEEASANDAVLVFDEADSLFGIRTGVGSSTDRYANMDVGLLLYHIEHYRGVVILCTNMVKEIDPAFFRRMKFVVEFVIPDGNERAVLWKKLIPAECPTDKSIDFARLGSKFEFSGGHIKSAIVRAATRAALREAKRYLTNEDLENAAKEEQEKGEKITTTNLYS